MFGTTHPRLETPSGASFQTLRHAPPKQPLHCETRVFLLAGVALPSKPQFLTAPSWLLVGGAGGVGGSGGEVCSGGGRMIG